MPRRAPAGAAPSARRFADFLRTCAPRWYLYLPIFAIWGFAYARLFIDATPRVPVLFNWTPSLPYRVAWLQHGPHPLQRGDFIVFSFAGEAQARTGITRPALLQDRARLAGRRRDRRRPARWRSTARRSAWPRPRPTTAGRSPDCAHRHPAGHYYVQGTSPDSFDSRYQESGLVRAEQVLGRRGAAVLILGVRTDQPCARTSANRPLCAADVFSCRRNALGGLPWVTAADRPGR
jgi:conjugal transfer pilin signal peptidase TrbI